MTGDPARSVLLLLTLAVPAPLAAQTASPPVQSREGVDILLSKARSLEARGRMDLAAQNWNEVLLLNPDQTEALAGLARYAKQNGDSEKERLYLGRLRQINPSDPAIAAIQNMRILSPHERSRLDEAGRLAAQHKPDEAMAIYHEVFGNEPPPGRWAEAFYETEAASRGGRDRAIAQLRDLCSRDPSNEVYRLWLARVLTYDPKTRLEGFRVLDSIHASGTAEQARIAWRQALVWEKDNPAAQGALEAYLQRYPDQALQKSLTALRAKQEHALRDAEEQLGFQALKNEDLTTAERKFEGVLRRSPNDAGALAGLGFVRLNQKRFDAALGLFERARAQAPQKPDVREGYETAKFWLAMQRGAALQQSDPQAAIAAYREASAVRPEEPQPVLAVGQILLRQGDVKGAAARFEEVSRQSPGNAEAIAGLGFVRLKEQKFDDAEKLLAQARTLSPERADLEEGYRTARFWGLMQRGAAALDANKPDVAATSYQQALALNPGAKDALVGMAAALEQRGDFTGASALYERLTTTDPADMRGWFGVVKARVNAKDPRSAVDMLQRLPQTTKRQLDSRPDYLAVIALAYYSAGQPADGDRALREALDAAARSDTDEALTVRLQVASLLLKDNRADDAVMVYRQATDLHPDNRTAWQGLIAAYASIHDMTRAEAALRAIPRQVYAEATNSTSFLNLAASVHSANGQYGDAEILLTRAMDLDKAAGRPPSNGTQLLLADTWMHQRQYDRAREASREVIERDQGSADGWRGYITALHETHDDQAAVREARRIPEGPRARLWSDAGFLTLLASAHGTVGEKNEALELLEQARARYRAAGRSSPVDLDVQLGWAMLAAPGREGDLATLLTEAKSRDDATPDQRAAIDEITTNVRLRSADEALRSQGVQRALAILTDAGRELPGDPRIQSKLGSIWMMSANESITQHKYDEAEHDLESGLTAISNARSSQHPPGPPNMPSDATSGDQALAQRMRDELDLVKYRNSPYASAGGPVSERLGDPGVNRLVVLDGTATASVVLGDTARIGAEGHAITLDSGMPDGHSGYRFGTLPLGATFAQQTATGFAGEVQLSTNLIGVALGATPQGFLTNTWTAGVRIGPAGGPVKVVALRESVKDSLLSYAGTRDPVTGTVWGGVMSNSISLQLNHDSSGTGQYLTVSGALLRGQEVADNWNAQGIAGAYWPIVKMNDVGVSLGLNVTGMHYDQNLNFFSLGQGGYFSPQAYLLGQIPVVVSGQHDRFEYSVTGAGGLQHIVQDPSPLYPMGAPSIQPSLQSVDKATTVQTFYDGQTTTGPNYYALVRVSYHLASRWYLDAFATANNTRDFTSRSVGISLKLLVQPRPFHDDLHVPAVPDWKGNQPFRLR